MFPDSVRKLLRPNQVIVSSSQGSDSGVSISLPAVANTKWAVEKLILNTDIASEVRIERPIGTIEWKFKLPANVAPFILEDILYTNASQSVAIIISQSTTICYANMKVYSIS